MEQHVFQRIKEAFDSPNPSDALAVLTKILAEQGMSEDQIRALFNSYVDMVEQQLIQEELQKKGGQSHSDGGHSNSHGDHCPSHRGQPCDGHHDHGHSHSHNGGMSDSTKCVVGCWCVILAMVVVLVWIVAQYI